MPKNNGKNANIKQANGGTLRELFSYIRKYWLLLACTVLLSLATVVCTLYVPVLIGDGIDCIVGAGRVDFQTLQGILWQIALLVVGAALTQWLSGLFSNRIAYQVV